MDLRLRRARASDAAVVARVYVSSWNQGFASLIPPRVLDGQQVDRWRWTLSNDATRWWLAESGNDVLGFAGSGPSRDPVDSDLGELDTMAVAPEAWRRGVGRRLMEAAVSDLVAARYHDAILWTLTDYERGMAFYRATGWRPSGELRDGGRQKAFRQALTGR